MAKSVPEAPYIDEDEMQQVYHWVDEIPLSRPKRNIARDFADGGKDQAVLMAEAMKHFLPRLVDIHNYVPAHSVQQKIANWSTLNRIIHAEKVFKKMGFQLARTDIEKVANALPDAIERVASLIRLKVLTNQIADYREGKTSVDSPTYTAPRMRIDEPSHKEYQRDVDPEQVREKEQTIIELKETIEILELKIKKLEQLVRLKDSKIQSLADKLASGGHV